MGIWDYIEVLKQLSIIKTLRFNIHYFGLGTMMKNGPYCFIAKNVKLSSLKGKVIVHNPRGHRVRLGFTFNTPYFDNRYERFIWHNTGTVVFQGHSQIRIGSKIDNSGYLEIGEDVLFTALTTIICKNKISIGNSCAISWRTLLMDTDHHSITDEKGDLINQDQPITIGDQVWISSNVTILKGTEINSQSIVAAGAVLSGKKFEEQNIIIGGNGRVLKRNIHWKPHPPASWNKSSNR